MDGWTELRHFFVPTNRLVESLMIDGQYYRVIEHAFDDLVAIDEDGNAQALDREDFIVYRLNVERLGKVLCYAKGWTVAFESLSAGVWRIGREKGTTPKNIYVCIQHSEEEYDRAVALVRQFDETIPQQIFVASTITAIHFSRSDIQSLEEHFPEGDESKFVPTDSPLLPTKASGIGAIGSSTDALPPYVFRRMGTDWQFRFNGGTVYSATHRLGASYLCELLSSPGKTIAVTDLKLGSAIKNVRRTVSSENAIQSGMQVGTDITQPYDEKIDPTTKQTYASSLSDLSYRRERAIEDCDQAELDRIDEEFAMIESELNAALGLGRRIKREGDVKKKMRDSVRSNINRFIKEHINKVDKNFADHLLRSIKFGNLCVYNDTSIHWTTGRDSRSSSEY